MSLSADTLTELMAALTLTSVNVEHPVLDNSPLLPPTDRHDIATSEPSVTGNLTDACEPVEKPEVQPVSSITSEDQLQANRNPGTEMAWLTDIFARLQIGNENGAQKNVFSRGSSDDTQGLTAVEITTNENLGTFPDIRPIQKEQSTTGSPLSILKSSEASDPPSKPQQLPAAAEREESPENKLDGVPSRSLAFPELDIGKLDLQENDTPESQGLPTPTRPSVTGISQIDGSGTPPNDSPRQQEDNIQRYLTPPPSPSPANISGTTVQSEDFFTIQPSKLGGLGVFATRDLKKGQIILVERPLLRTTHFRLMSDYSDLSDNEKKMYLSLHGADGDPFSRVRRIKQLNSFAVPYGIAIFALASRFNHACPPSPARNITYTFTDTDADSDADGGGFLTLTVCRDRVPAGTELCISYGGTPAELFTTYGFRCACGGCDGFSEEDVRRMRELEFGGEGW